MPIAHQPIELDIIFLTESWLHVVSHEHNQKSYFSSEQSKNEVKSQNDVRKTGPRTKIIFLKSISKNVLEWICI